MNIYFKKINFPALLLFVNEKLFLWELVFSYFPKNCKKVPCNLSLHPQRVRCCPRNIVMFRRRLVQRWKAGGGVQNDHGPAFTLPRVSGLLRSCWLWPWASYFSASFKITWRIIGFLILKGVWKNGPKARMSRWALRSLSPPPQVLQNLPAAMGDGAKLPGWQSARNATSFCS